MFEEKAKELIQNSNEAKEVFVMEELQKYMDFSDPENPKWIEPVKMRLQEKEDFKKDLRDLNYLVNKFPCNCRDNIICLYCTFKEEWRKLVE